jgi:SAM-dependent methyltransferase
VTERFDDPDRTAWGSYWADVHDEWMGAEIDQDCLLALKELANGGPVLELGIGTGRVAIPLVLTGLTVHGFETSPAMIEKLREKPGGDQIKVIQENYVDMNVEGKYRLIPWIDWGPFLLHSQDEQVRCIQNAADHLEDGGFLVVEMPTRVPIPDNQGPNGSEHLLIESITSTSVGLWAVDYNPLDQTLFTQQILLKDGSVQLQPVPMRYVSPAEIDLMARMAGLKLKYRWSNWQRAAMTSESSTHISVYEKPAQP